MKQPIDESLATPRRVHKSRPDPAGGYIVRLSCTHEAWIAAPPGREMYCGECLAMLADQARVLARSQERPRTMPDFTIKTRYAGRIRWSRRGSCGMAGCKDQECCCALCGEPIGVPEDDPRWDDHDEYCDECELCRDQVPLMLFRGEGKAMEQASFHGKCFEKIAFIRECIAREGAGV